MPVEPLALDSDDSLEEIAPPSSSIRTKGKQKHKEKREHKENRRKRSNNEGARSESNDPSSATTKPSSSRDKGTKGKGKEKENEAQSTERIGRSSNRSASRGVAGASNRTNAGDADMSDDSRAADADEDDESDTVSHDGLRPASLQANGSGSSSSAQKCSRRQSSTPKPHDARAAKAVRTDPSAISEDEVEEAVCGPQTDHIDSGPSNATVQPAGDALSVEPVPDFDDDFDDDDEDSTLNDSDSVAGATGEPFYTSSEGSSHGSDSEDGLGSWNRYDKRNWQGDTSHLNAAYNGHYPLRGVMRHRKHPRHGYVQYRALWSGYPIYASTWEPETMFDDPKTIKEYWDRIGGRPTDCPPPPPGWEHPAVDSDDTDIAQYRRPWTRAHEALRKRRLEIRRDKYDSRKLIASLSATKRCRDEAELQRLERLRQRRNVTMDTLRMRDSNDEDHVRSKQRREKRERIRLKKWRRSQQQGANSADPSSVFPKNFTGSSRVLLPNISMKGNPRAAPVRVAKTRAAEIDDLPTEDLVQKAFRPAPAATAGPPHLRAPPPPIAPAAARSPPPRPPPGSYKGAHHRPPKVKVMNPDANVKSKRLIADNPWSKFMQQDDEPARPNAAAGPAPSTASNTAGPSTNAGPSHIHSSRRGLVPTSSDVQPASTSNDGCGWDSPDSPMWQPPQPSPPQPSFGRTAAASMLTADPRRRPDSLPGWSASRSPPPPLQPSRASPSMLSPDLPSTAAKGVHFNDAPARSGWSPSSGPMAMDGSRSPLLDGLPADRPTAAWDAPSAPPPTARSSATRSGAPPSRPTVNGVGAPQTRPAAFAAAAAAKGPSVSGFGPSPPTVKPLWNGTVEFTLGHDAIAFQAQLWPHSERSTGAAIKLGFDQQAAQLRFDAVYPMPLFRELAHNITRPLAPAASLLEACGPTRDAGAFELEHVSQLLFDSDLLVACRLERSGGAVDGRYYCLGIFSSHYPAELDDGRPHGFPPLVSPQLWTVPIELDPGAAPSRSFFHIPKPISPDVVDYFREAMSFDRKTLSDRDLNRRDVDRAVQLAGRYLLTGALVKCIKRAYNLIYSGARSPGSVEFKAVFAFIRVLAGGWRESLSQATDEKLWRKRGCHVNVFVRNAARLALFDDPANTTTATVKFPLGEHLRRLKRLPRCHFFTYGFAPDVKNEHFSEIFPLDGGGLVTLSLSALLAELFQALPEEGHLGASQGSTKGAATSAEKVLQSLPSRWFCLLHPWLISTLRLLEPCLREVLEGLGICEAGSTPPPMFELEGEIEAFATSEGFQLISLSEIASPPFDEPSEASIAADPLKVVRELDEEIFRTMVELQRTKLYKIRFNVFVAGPGATERSEAELAGVETISFDELVGGGCTTLNEKPGNP